MPEFQSPDAELDNRWADRADRYGLDRQPEADTYAEQSNFYCAYGAIGIVRGIRYSQRCTFESPNKVPSVMIAVKSRRANGQAGLGRVTPNEESMHRIASSAFGLAHCMNRLGT